MIVVDISAISGAVAALKGTKDLFDATVGIRDAAAFQEKQLELQSKIMAAQSAVFVVNEERTELLEKIARLEKEIAILTSWDVHKKQYKRVAVASRFSVYVLADVDNPKQADYWLCANCFDDRKLAHLQQVPLSVGRALVTVCPRCKSLNYVQGQAISEHADIIGKLTR